MHSRDQRKSRSQSAAASRCFKDAVAGETSAVAQLLEAYRPLLLKLANEQLDPELRQKAAASDVVQNSIIKATLAFPSGSFHRLQDVISWLREILDNEIATAHRRFRKAQKRDARRERSISSVHSRKWIDVLALRSRPESGVTLSRQEVCKEVRSAFDGLPPHYRQIIQWRVVDELTFPAIAVKLGRNNDAVRMLYNRAKKCLEAELRKQGHRPVIQS